MKGMAVCVRDRIQDNCQIIHNKSVSPTKLVGFLMHMRRLSNDSCWTGKLAIRLNNNNLHKNPLRYNYIHILLHMLNHILVFGQNHPLSVINGFCCRNPLKIMANWVSWIF